MKLSARNQLQLRSKAAGLRHCGADSSLGDLRCIGPPRTPLHIRELVAQGVNATARKTLGDVRQERVGHACPSSVSQDIARAGARCGLMKGGDFLAAFEGYGQRAGSGRTCEIGLLCLRSGSRCHCGMCAV